MKISLLHSLSVTGQSQNSLAGALVSPFPPKPGGVCLVDQYEQLLSSNSVGAEKS